MDGYEPETYGERIADIYEDVYGDMSAETAATVDFLAGIAPGNRALELGVGTGRVAIPLAERGIEVLGIDASPAMLDKLREKPGGHSIHVSLGDFAGVETEGLFSLVYVVFNTFFNLTSQDDQIRCFRNVASHLDEDGVFVVEAFVPDMTRFTRHQNVGVERVGIDEVILDVTKHDPVSQQLVVQHVIVRPSGIRLSPLTARYAWPSELDLMAALAGMSLRERWGGWRRERFDERSVRHVSVYERTATSYM